MLLQIRLLFTLNWHKIQFPWKLPWKTNFKEPCFCILKMRSKIKIAQAQNCGCIHLYIRQSLLSKHIQLFWFALLFMTPLSQENTSWTMSDSGLLARDYLVMSSSFQFSIIFQKSLLKTHFCRLDLTVGAFGASRAHCKLYLLDCNTILSSKSYQLWLHIHLHQKAFSLSGFGLHCDWISVGGLLGSFLLATFLHFFNTTNIFFA